MRNFIGRYIPSKLLLCLQHGSALEDNILAVPDPLPHLAYNSVFLRGRNIAIARWGAAAQSPQLYLGHFRETLIYNAEAKREFPPPPPAAVQGGNTKTRVSTINNRINTGNYNYEGGGLRSRGVEGPGSSGVRTFGKRARDRSGLRYFPERETGEHRYIDSSRCQSGSGGNVTLVSILSSLLGEFSFIPLPSLNLPLPSPTPGMGLYYFDQATVTSQTWSTNIWSISTYEMLSSQPCLARTLTRAHLRAFNVHQRTYTRAQPCFLFLFICVHCTLRT